MIIKKEVLFEFGEKLAALMKKRGITNEKLAEVIECSPQMISSYRTHKNFPELERLFAIADYFDVSIDYLLGRKRDISLYELINIDYIQRKLGARVEMKHTQVSGKSLMLMSVDIYDVISKPSIYPRNEYGGMDLTLESARFDTVGGEI